MFKYFVIFLFFLLIMGCGEKNAPPPQGQTADEPKTTQTKALETGAQVLQPNTPPKQLDI